MPFQDQHKIKPINIPARGGGGAREAPPLAESYWPFLALEEGESVFLRGVASPLKGYPCSGAWP